LACDAKTLRAIGCLRNQRAEADGRSKEESWRENRSGERLQLQLQKDICALLELDFKEPWNLRLMQPPWAGYDLTTAAPRPLRDAETLPFKHKRFVGIEAAKISSSSAAFILLLLIGLDDAIPG
jgi:hypothetical protein